MPKLCKFDACDNDVRYPILGVCATCYSGLRLWSSRTPEQKRLRAQQYTRMQERMDYLMDGRGLMPGYRKKLTQVNKEIADRAARVRKANNKNRGNK